MNGSRQWQGALTALGLVAGGAALGSLGTIAINADKVDGFDAVSSTASIARRAGKLVATGKNGRVPDAAKFSGYKHRDLATISIPPTAAAVSGSASASSVGPNLTSTGNSTMVVAFVVPPDHDPADPIMMDVVYLEPSPGACAWSVSVEGLEGPDGPQSASNVHNAGWVVPGTDGFEGNLAVPAGAGTAHKATFSFGFESKPGMFIQFALTRIGGDPADTCSDVTISGLQVRY